MLNIAGVKAAVKAGRIVTKSTPVGSGLDHPLSPQQCRDQVGVPCYGAPQLRRTYGLDKLAERGVDGRGTTTALIMPYHNPAFVHDVTVHSREFGLGKPNVTVIRHGQVPTADPADPGQAIAEEEALLDAEMIRTAAPKTHLIYLETSPALFNGPDGFRGVGDELNWLTEHTHVDAASFSYGWFEANYTEFFGDKAKAAAALREQSQLVAQVVRRRHVSVLTADGDTGPTGPDLNGTALYPAPTPAFLASSPWITAVSGTELHVRDDGTRVAPDTVWGEYNGDQYATGGAPSGYFPRPSYQDPVRNVTGDHRGVGDVAMVGSVASQVWMYTSKYQALNGQKPGWVHTAGTSAASPLMTGVVANAAQVAHRPLGLINPALYRLARTAESRRVAGIADVMSGCNTVTGVQGYCGKPGYDLASGVGTVGDASRFVPALAGAARR